MSEPQHDNASPQPNRLSRGERHLRRRNRMLQATAILPSLATVLNGLSGFAAVGVVTKEGIGEAPPWRLMAAAGLIFLAMVFDVLDGRLARMTRRTSDFGGQLDSLCDMVSFGLAPAVITLQTASVAYDHIGGHLLVAIQRGAWCAGAIYVACAALRLARFNVESVPDESAHMNFKGLPSPGAAAAVMSVVLLFASMMHEQLLQAYWHYVGWAVTLPLVTLLCGLLMVSRFRYPHVVNQFIRGKRSFNYLVKAVIVIVAAVTVVVVFSEQKTLSVCFAMLAALAVGFAFSGPLGAMWRRWRGAPAQPPPGP